MGDSATSAGTALAGASVLIARLVLGTLLLWAGTAKLVNGRTFARLLKAWRPTSGALGLAIRRLLPLTEISMGLALLIGLRTEAIAIAALVFFMLSALL